MAVPHRCPPSDTTVATAAHGRRRFEDRAQSPVCGPSARDAVPVVCGPGSGGRTGRDRERRPAAFVRQRDRRRVRTQRTGRALRRLPDARRSAGPAGTSNGTVPIGTAFPHLDAVLLDENGCPADDGELYVRGAHRPRTPARPACGAPVPYLLQHASNPVAWWPWGKAAMTEAERRDVPVFLSMGYRSCGHFRSVHRSTSLSTRVPPLIWRSCGRTPSDRASATAPRMC
ncbi:DUF255 domain-containing protein [Streptomyces sp. NPDC059278]|uniref:DUF255 domain-containing protein n=1 Tax=Streptomyces sp. NPDC059278 TaxID=3346801 RepID=UPI0036B062FD